MPCTAATTLGGGCSAAARASAMHICSDAAKLVEHLDLHTPAVLLEPLQVDGFACRSGLSKSAARRSGKRVQTGTMRSTVCSSLQKTDLTCCPPPLPDAVLICSAAVCALSVDRLVTVTLAPCCTSFTAVARPMPDDPPVIKTCFPRAFAKHGGSCSGNMRALIFQAALQTASCAPAKVISSP